MNTKPINWKQILFIISLFLFVIMVWVLSWYLIDITITTDTGKGTFGDKFGAVNALFSGLAFAGIIFTIFLQSKELSLQRDELKLQRDELKETRLVFESQNNMISQQKFENTFFQMLNLFSDLVNAIDVDSGSRTIQGRDCFRGFYHSFVNHFNNSKEEPSQEKHLHAYSKLYDTHRSDLSHYFRTLYHIYKFIDRSEIENKRQYASIVRAQLSSYEQILLFYNCLHANGNEKFKPLIENYAILKNIDAKFLLENAHLSLYTKGAFENLEDNQN